MLDALKSYVRTPSTQNQAEDTVLLHVTHSNLKQHFIEIRFDLHVSNFCKYLSVSSKVSVSRTRNQFLSLPYFSLFSEEWVSAMSQVSWFGDHWLGRLLEQIRDGIRSSELSSSSLQISVLKGEWGCLVGGYEMQTTIERVKEKLRDRCGTPVESMSLQLYDDTNTKVCDLIDDFRPIGYYSPLDG